MKCAAILTAISATAQPLWLTHFNGTADSPRYEVLSRTQHRIECPEAFVIQPGHQICRKVLREAPLHSCPQGFTLADGQCIKLFRADWMCPRGLVNIGDNRCERSISMPCATSCRGDSRPTSDGQCVTEKDYPMAKICSIGNYEASEDSCVVETTSGTTRMCLDPSATYEDGVCVKVEKSNNCDPDRDCIRLRTFAARETCQPGSTLSKNGQVCIRRQKVKPILICEKILVDGRCITTEIVPQEKTCPFPGEFRKREVFGMCGCFKSEFENATPYCSADSTAVWESKSQSCVSRLPVKFTCPPQYKLTGTVCNKIIDQPVIKYYNMTVSCQGDC